MARASTTPQPAPAPCKMRPASSIGRLAASMQAAAPQVKSTSPPRSTRLRPKRSERPPYATVKKAIDSIASDIVSCVMPVETSNVSFTAGIAGINRWSDSGPMKVTETSAMKKYQRGRKDDVMLVRSMGFHREILHEQFGISPILQASGEGSKNSSSPDASCTRNWSQIQGTIEFSGDIAFASYWR